MTNVNVNDECASTGGDNDVIDLIRVAVLDGWSYDDIISIVKEIYSIFIVIRLIQQYIARTQIRLSDSNGQNVPTDESNELTQLTNLSQ